MPLIQAVVRTRPPWDRWTEIDVPNVSACTALHRVCVCFRSWRKVTANRTLARTEQSASTWTTTTTATAAPNSKERTARDCETIARARLAKVRPGLREPVWTSYLLFEHLYPPPHSVSLPVATRSSLNSPADHVWPDLGLFWFARGGGVGFDWTRRLQWPCDESWGRENVALSASARVIPTRSPFM